MAKYYDKKTHAHEQAVHWFAAQVYAMRSTFNKHAVEAGIDGMIELADPQTEAATGRFLGVQVKTKEQFAAENERQFSFYADPPDIAYWNSVEIPVLLVVVRARTEEAYAVHIQSYFATPETRNSKTVVFDKARDRFVAGDDWQRRLLNLGIPRSRGLGFPPVPADEDLLSNLLEAELPETIFHAKTGYKTRDPVLKVLHARHFKGEEFIIRDGWLWTPYSLSEVTWSALVEQPTIKPMPFRELAFHEHPAKRRHAVELLNYCLNARLALEDVFWLERERLYAYAPERSVQRTVRTTLQREQRESRKGLLHVTEKGGRVVRYRHVAMKPRFVEVGGVYCLDVDPTYFYTRDGKKKHRRSVELIRNARIMEKQKEYLANLDLWRHILTQRADLLREDYPFLKFKDYMRFTAPVSIPDEVWKPDKESKSTDSNQAQLDY